MRHRILTALAMLTAAIALLSGCASAPRTGTPSVAETVWSGSSDTQAYVEFHFRKDGTLDFKSDQGFWPRAGTWKQDNQSIYIEMNNRFAEYKGVISGLFMHGRGSNVQGLEWNWKVRIALLSLPKWQ